MATDVRVLIRKRAGKGFTYRYKKSGKTLKNEKIRDWIKSLAIPPAWSKVEISLDKKAKVHSFGRDAKGRKQYIYNEKFRKKRELAKYDHIIEFAKRLPSARKKIEKDFKKDKLTKKSVLAAMVKMLDSAQFRAGSKYYSKNNQTYGLTTLRSKHLKEHKNYIEFSYTGKSGKEQERVIKDDELREIILNLDELSGYEIFKYKNKKGKIKKIDRNILNDYISTRIGEGFTAKDFRTWAGTCFAAIALSELGPAKNKKDIKKNVIKTVDSVAKVLGNTRSVAKASYIDPRVIKKYEQGYTITSYLKEIKKEIKENRYLFSKNAERAVLKLIEDKIK